MSAESAFLHGLNVPIPAFAGEANEVNVVVDTPKGSRNKFKYDPDLRLFTLSGVLPAGAVFPYDFGDVPSTLGEDGDPLDVLILMDEPAFVGCLVQTRLIGVVEAEQTEDGKTVRNDRLIGVAVESRDQEGIDRLDQLNDHLLLEIEHFFVSYNEVKGKRFAPRGRRGPDRALALVREGVARLERSQADGPR